MSMNHNMDAEVLFYEIFNGQPNFVTPDVMYRKYITSDVAVELSSGRMFHDPIFGVTFLDRSDPDASDGVRTYSKGGFPSQEDAEDYIEAVKIDLMRNS